MYFCGLARTFFSQSSQQTMITRLLTSMGRPPSSILYWQTGQRAVLGFLVAVMGDSLSRLAGANRTRVQSPRTAHPLGGGFGLIKEYVRWSDQTCKFVLVSRRR